MSMSTVAFLAKLDPGISVYRTPANCRFFLDRFAICFKLLGFLFFSFSVRSL